MTASDHTLTSFENRLTPRVSINVRLASFLFALIILAAIASNWALLAANIAVLGPALATLILVMMLLGLGVAALIGLSWKERKTISIEVGIQNGTLGITLAPLIVGATAGIPAIGLPSAVYGVLMYMIGLPIVFWLRGK